MFKGLFGSKSETTSVGNPEIRTNVNKLSSRDTQVRRAATEVLFNLAITNKDAIREARGIAPLIVLLKDSDTVVKQNAAAALWSLANNATNQDAIREARGIPLLIALLKDPDTLVKQHAVSALRNLAVNETNKVTIREGQGIAPLIALLKDPDTIVKQKAAAALLNLAGNITNQTVIREAQGIAPLVVLLKDPDTEVKKQASCALMSLAANATNQDAIREAQGILPLIALLKDSDIEVKKHAAGALLNLTLNTTNEDAIREAHGIAPLIALLKDADTEVKQDAAAALWNLAYNNLQNQAVILDNGATPLLHNLASTDENARKTLKACLLLMESRKNEEKGSNEIAALSSPANTPLPLSNTQASVTSNRTDSTSSQLKSTAPLPPAKPKKPSRPSSQVSPTLQELSRQPTAQQGGEKEEQEAKPEELSAKMENTSLKGSGDRSPSSVPSITFSSLQIDTNKRLGQGGFGIVYKGTWQMVTVAIKQLHATRLSAEALKAFEEEAQCHGLLRHPNTVMLFGVCVEPGLYGMVMEFMAGGSLYDLLHSSKDMPWSLRLSIAHNISVGLYYLHENNIIHRDLKSLNVLLDEHNQAKLADFGLSTVKSETQSTTTVTTTTPGTIRWMAPELFKRGAKCTTASDIYALGWIFWELSSRKIPFQDEAQATNELIKDWVKDGEREAIPISTPPQFAHLLTQCWAQRTEERPSTAKAVAEAIPSADAEPSLSSGYAYYSQA